MPSRSFVELFAEQARTRPDAPALSWHGRVLRYAELAAWADAAHAELVSLRIADGAPVCVPARKSPETVALLIACFRAGRRVLLPSAGLGPQALASLCSRAGCTHVLSAGEGGPGGPPAVVSRPSGAAPGGGGDLPPGAGLLLTTSGSTGTPKTVVLDSSGADRFMSWAAGRFGIGPGTRVLNYAPLNFDLCLLDVWATLAAGGCAELVDPDHGVDGVRLADLCVSRAPHVLQAVPLFFRLVTEVAAVRGLVFPEARDVLLTGDAAPPGLLERIAATFPAARLWNVYGCTETNDSFLHRITPEEIGSGGAVPIGGPVDGVAARIVDADGRTVTGAGSGELMVATPFQAHGYLGRTPDGERWRDGWFRTGDLVRRDERGLVFLTGRGDHQVKVRGVRTNLAEVERVVMDHPQVGEAAVLAVPDAAGDNVLHAVVRRTPGSGLNSLGLRVHCAAALPRTAIPAVFEITDEPLPVTSTGKVDRNALRRARSPRPAPEPAPAPAPGAAATA
ncbi:AMP-binding protein [Streptomyces nanhaiensis]|uniref:AMP-binding protein n=1 Tax=Streptomyces nanhaiensis TaxID=679319 RepID=UPI00399C8EC5